VRIFSTSTEETFSAGDDHVLQPVDQLDVSVRMPHAEIARPQPVTSDRRRRGRLRVIVVTEHYARAADDDLADRFAVRLDRSPVGVEDVDRTGDHVANPLPGVEHRALLIGEGRPLGLPLVDHARPVRLRQAVEVRDRDAERPEPCKQGGRRRRAARLGADLPARPFGRAGRASAIIVSTVGAALRCVTSRLQIASHIAVGSILRRHT
jgi:hypothetical protein